MPKIGIWREAQNKDSFDFLFEMPIEPGQNEGEFFVVLGISAITQLRDILNDSLENIRNEVEEVTEVPDKHQSVLVAKARRKRGLPD